MLFCKTPWLGPTARGRNKKAQREEIIRLLLQLFTTCLVKPVRISVPFHPHRRSPHRTASHKKSGPKRKSCLLALVTGTHQAPCFGEQAATGPQAIQATHPAKGHPGEKIRWRWQHKVQPEGSRAVIYPNPARGGEGGSDGMRHLAVPGRRCGNAVRPPSPARPARLPFSTGRKGTIAIQGLPGSRPPQIRTV